MAEQHTPAESKKIHGDKLAEAFEPPPPEPEDKTHSDVRLLSRHPAATSGHVVRR